MSDDSGKPAQTALPSVAAKAKDELELENELLREEIARSRGEVEKLKLQKAPPSKVAAKRPTALMPILGPGRVWYQVGEVIPDAIADELVDGVHFELS